MRLWRISEHVELDGAGGLFAAGRWNRIGRPVVYLADTSALALLETLIRRTRARLPPPYQLLEVDLPDGLDVTYWPADADPTDTLLAQDWGDAFLKSRATPLARVPSVVAPRSWNWLLNPLHPDAARASVAAAARWPWDARLFEG